MDDSSNYDISAQNNVMSSIGGMNQAVKDHNDRIKNTFQQRFQIDDAGHKMKEYMTAGHDLSEGVGSLKATGEFIKTVGEARKLGGGGIGATATTYLSPGFQKSIASRNIKEFSDKVKTYLNDGEKPSASSAASDDAVGKAAKGTSEAGEVAEQGVTTEAAKVDPHVQAMRDLAKADGLSETSPGSGVWKRPSAIASAEPKSAGLAFEATPDQSFYTPIKPAAPAAPGSGATIPTAEPTIPTAEGVDVTGVDSNLYETIPFRSVEATEPVEADATDSNPFRSALKPVEATADVEPVASDIGALPSTSTFKEVNPFDTITSFPGDPVEQERQSAALAEAQQRARGILTRASGPTPAKPPAVEPSPPSSGSAAARAPTADVEPVASDIGDVAKEALKPADQLASDVAGSISKLKAGAGLAGTAVGVGSGLYTLGRDLFDKGYFKNLNQSQQDGNIAGMVAGGLDAASVALPFLAPLAIGASIFSAVEDTLGEHEKGDPEKTKDTEEETSQLETAPAQVASLTSQGLIASQPIDVHASITGTASF